MNDYYELLWMIMPNEKLNKLIGNPHMHEASCIGVAVQR
jgi:hypothetical protein